MQYVEVLGTPVEQSMVVQGLWVPDGGDHVQVAEEVGMRIRSSLKAE